jgi:hypothetical protein
MVPLKVWQTSVLANQGCRVCFAYPIFQKYTLFWSRTLENLELHTQFWPRTHPEVSFLAKPMWQTDAQSDGRTNNLEIQMVLDANCSRDYWPSVLMSKTYIPGYLDLYQITNNIVNQFVRSSRGWMSLQMIMTNKHYIKNSMEYHEHHTEQTRYCRI